MKLRKRTRHAGIVEIDVEFWLKVLDLEGGELHDIHIKDNYLPHKTIHMVIEHPDFPKVNKRKPLEVVTIIHQTTCGDNGVPIRIERVDPPKNHVGK